MKTLPLAIATALYLWQGVNFAVSGQRGMVMVFAGYAFANIGLMMAARS